LGGTCKKIFSALTRRLRPPQTLIDGYAPVYTSCTEHNC